MTQRMLKGGAPLRVRPAEPSDAEQLVELLHRADEESPFLGREPGESRLTAEMERGMIEDLDGSDSQVWLVAETEGRIIGLCSVGRVRHTRRFRHRGEVMLVVARDSWGQGAGSALLEDGIAWARRQGLRSMGRGIADMALGFLLISLLPVVYLWANHSLRLGMEVYFVQNLTGYSGEAMTLTGHLYNALAYLRTQGAINPGILVLAALGIVLCLVRAVICRTRGWLFQALLMPAGAGLLLLTVYWGEMAHPYYALVFAGLVPAGLGAVCILAEWLWHLSQKPTVLAALSLVLAIPIVPLAMHFCLSWPLAGVKAGDMPQTILAHEMEAEGGGTLLDLSGHDQGFYLASGTLPVCRYFADNNLNTEEKQAALMGYLESGKTEFVISRFRDPGQLYQPVMTVSGFFDLMDLREYTLYRRVEDGH